MSDRNQTTDHAMKLRAAADYFGGTYDGLDDELRDAADELDRLRNVLIAIRDMAGDGPASNNELAMRKFAEEALPE